jgi:hypothetical protein
MVKISPIVVKSHHGEGKTLDGNNKTSLVYFGYLPTKQGCLQKKLKKFIFRNTGQQ